MTRLTSLPHWFKPAADSASVSGCVGQCDGLSGQESKARPAYTVVRAGRGWPELRTADTESNSPAGRGSDCECTPRGGGEGSPRSGGKSLFTPASEIFDPSWETRPESRPPRVFCEATRGATGTSFPTSAEEGFEVGRQMATAELDASWAGLAPRVPRFRRAVAACVGAACHGRATPVSPPAVAPARAAVPHVLHLASVTAWWSRGDLGRRRAAPQGLERARFTKLAGRRRRAP
jgi:hypothetical protein